MLDNKTTSHLSAHDVRRDVQGLRALAVLAVLVFHIDKDWLPSGFTGVDMFLVISGFIITSMLLKQGEVIDWKLFYWARLRRILPAYLIMLTLVTLLAAWLFLPADLEIYQDSIRSALGFYRNLYLSDLDSYSAPASHELPLLHTWSLAIEMQFYLFFTLLLGLTPVRYRASVIAFLIVATLGYSQYQLFIGKAPQAYFSSIGRAGEFLIGALLALISLGRNWSTGVATAVGGAVLILVAAGFTAVGQRSFPGLWVLFPCLGTALLIAARNGQVNVLLSHRVAVLGGGLSYSIYLWHWPLLAFYRYYTGTYELTWPAIASIVSLTFILSVISLRWIEIPARRLKLTSSGFGIAAAMARYAKPEEICHGRLVGNCVWGDKDLPSEALVIGYSHGHSSITSLMGQARPKVFP